MQSLCGLSGTPAPTNTIQPAFVGGGVRDVPLGNKKEKYMKK